MNVIFIAPGFLSTKGYSGGSTNIIHLAKGLNKRGARITIITSKAGEKILRDAHVEGNYKLIDNRQEMSTALPVVIFTMLIRMIKVCLLFARKRLDEGTVVYAVSELIWDEFPLIFVRGKNTKRISFFCMPFPSPLSGYKGAFTGRGLPDLRATLGFIQQWFSFICFRHVSDCIVTPSNLNDFLINIKIPQEKITTYAPGVDWDFINNITAGERIYDACWIGRYHAMKGLEDLLEVWEEVCQVKPEAKLVLMGDVVEQLEPLIKQNHLEENIRLTGAVSEEEKFKIMKESKIFVFPSYYESWNRAICEAMACDLPAVAYDLPVYKDTYPEGMVTVPIGDKKALTNEIMRVLENDEERETLSRQAKEVALLYDPDQIAQGFVEAVRRIEARQGAD
ncbi:glycosyltransferase family 4 protein [Chloroflexota bacterium]